MRRGNVLTTLVAGMGMITIMVIVVAIAVASMLYSWVSREQSLANAIAGRSSTVMLTIDKAWKTIQQKANITKDAAATAMQMNQVYAEIAEPRGSGGAVFKMVQEANPNLSTKDVLDLYANLMQSVESQRATVLNESRVLQDLVREHADAQTLPGRHFVLGLFGGPLATTPFKKKGDAGTPAGWPEDRLYVFVTSSATKAMAESGEENDVSVFPAPTASGTK